ncbi:MAG: hypothetical protein JWP81_465 [Ferruginibacter sp.]|nr:hypothetical protein [Ferruginibacter sp.]
MKKLLFAAQVFGLIAMFPFLVLLEMNHVKGDSSKNPYPSGVITDTEKANTRLPGKKGEKVDEVSGIFTPITVAKTSIIN